MTDEKRIYLRNLHGCEGRVNLSDGRKIELKPRGQRGDMESVTEQEFKDQKLQDNIGLIFEPLSEESAQEVTEKQNTNRQEPHAPFAAITNERGEQYHQAEVPIEKSFEQQGEVVAKVESQPSLKNQEVRESIVREPSIDHESMSELIQAHGIERANEIIAAIQENPQMGPEQVQVPGSVSTDAHFADKQAKEDPAAMVNELRANAEITETTKE
jgi:hypothetical protein